MTLNSPPVLIGNDLRIKSVIIQNNVQVVKYIRYFRFNLLFLLRNFERDLIKSLNGSLHGCSHLHLSTLQSLFCKTQHFMLIIASLFSCRPKNHQMCIFPGVVLSTCPLCQSLNLLHSKKGLEKLKLCYAFQKKTAAHLWTLTIAH